MFVCIFYLASCSDQSDSENSNNEKFKAFVSQHTTGQISIADPIIVEFPKIIEQYSTSQKLPEEYLSISPKVDGELKIVDGKRLIFQPENHLKAGQKYRAELRLDEFYSDLDNEFQDFEFNFETITPDFKISFKDLQSYDDQWQYLNAVVETSDLMNSESLKKAITAKQKNENLKIKFENEDAENTFFNFKIDSIRRHKTGSKLILSWDGNEVGAKTSGEYEYNIPGEMDFQVLDVQTSTGNNPKLSINFSEPVSTSQNFLGLVEIDAKNDFNFDVDGNLLNIYPKENFSGNVELKIDKNLSNKKGETLKQAFSEFVTFKQLKPEVKLISEGVILPNANENPFYFEAVNLMAVDVSIIKIYANNILDFLQDANLNSTPMYQIKKSGRLIAKKTIPLVQNKVDHNGQWTAHAIDLAEIFQLDKASLYQVELSFNKAYSLYNCEESSEEKIKNFKVDTSTKTENFGENENNFWNNKSNRRHAYTYNWRERENPCHEAYYNDDKFASSNLLASDLGLIVKKSENGKYLFTASNLLTAEPISEAKIEVYNFQKQSIASLKTDQNGFAELSTSEYLSFATANHNENYAYLKIDDNQALQTSNFDVSGKSVKSGIDGFLYTERGVHRPGDDIYLTFVLNDIANPIPENHPVKLNFTDPSGRLIQEEVKNQGKNGFYTFVLKTDADDPTGNWTANVNIGDVSFQKTIKIASVKPNRLKIKLTSENEVLRANSVNTLQLKTEWLTGATAKNLDFEIETEIKTLQNPFEKFENYTFNSPIRTFKNQELSKIEGQVDGFGNETLYPEFNINNKAPGILKADFLTKVFEGGGDFSIDIQSKKLSPFSHYVGIKPTKQKPNKVFDTDENLQFETISLDSRGRTAGQRKLEVEIYKIDWRWWWNRGSDNLSEFEEAKKHKVYKTFEITGDKLGKASFSLKIPEKDRGRYLFRITDPRSGHSTGAVYYFYRNWWMNDSGSTPNSDLIFTADKNKYNVGETAKISFPSGSQGKALLTVENGTEILSKQWVDTQKGMTTTQIEISENMAPNVYVSITLLQAHKQTKNDLPIRMFGVIPLEVENANKKLQPKLNAPESIRPESDFKVEVSEENGKAMTYTLAMVDEGLLDLTNFRTPDIYNYFYAKKALGVKTFDVYDDVIGAFGGNIKNIYAIGGGDAAAAAKNRKAERFKPVVEFLGPFKLEKGETKQHQISMPNYIGSVKMMVVAGNLKNQAFGNTDQVVKVKKPLMTLLSAPRKLSPGETIKLPVTVFAMEDNIRNVDIELSLSEGLQPIGTQKKKINFTETGEQIVYFDFKVISSKSVENISVTAKAKGEKSSANIEIDVLNPNPISRQQNLIVIDENSSQTLNLEPFGVKGTNEAFVEFSALPPMNIYKRVDELVRYPHGCVEQTTSAAFPQLFLSEITEVSASKKQEIEDNIKAAISKLYDFQDSSGGVTYWSGGRISDWSTSYVGHFMLEAKRKGYQLPVSFLSNWMRFQKNQARTWRNNDRYNRSHTQAYRLFTLALAGQPEMAAMNKLRNSENLSNSTIFRLAHTYAIVGQTQVAEDLLKKAAITFQTDHSNNSTFGSELRDQSMALETLVAMKNEQRHELAEQIANRLSSDDWLSTQETAFALLALSKLIQNKNEGINLEFTQHNSTENIQSKKSIVKHDLIANTNSSELKIQNKANQKLYVSLVELGKLPLGEEMTSSKNLRVYSNFYHASGQALDISELRQGTAIQLEVIVENTSQTDLTNVALQQFIPSGWEIVNTSFTDFRSGENQAADYIDMRDDRVNFYFDLEGNKQVKFKLSLNASYLGEYYLPGAQVETMYDRNYFARNKGEWIKVVD